MQEKMLRKNAQTDKPAKPKSDILPSDNPKLISENQENLNAELRKCAYYGWGMDMKRIPQLIKEGADIMSKDGEDMTALHRAAQTGNAQVCMMLLEECAKKGKNIRKLLAAENMNNETARQIGNYKSRPFIAFADFMDDAFAPFMASFRDCLAS
jgi:hypothetical protein